jgi:hypothetical protein
MSRQLVLFIAIFSMPILAAPALVQGQVYEEDILAEDRLEEDEIFYEEQADEDEEEMLAYDEDEEDEPYASDDDDESIWYSIAVYLPNRVLDLLDIVRVRARVGPGIAAGVRVTNVAALYLGSYASIYAGLPGPRQRVLPRSPIGLESHNGVAFGPFSASANMGMDPDYSPTEVGLGLQAVVVGVDVGIDPVEIVDFVGGVFLFDLRDDDF